MPLSKVRVLAPDPGGGFGGKQHAKYEPLVAFMALRAGRPVRLVLSLEESFQAVRRAASEVRVRTGLRSDGTIAFQDIAADYLIGAYVDIADRVVSKGSYVGAGPYRMPAARIVARGVLSHTVPSTAFRGFGNPQVNWAVESNLDEGARQLGIDRLAIRLRNLARKGEAFIPWDTPADGDWQQTVRRAAELIGWHTPTPPGRGRGIAVGLKSGPTTGLSYSTVRLLADGSVVVYAGTSDMGQGARTVFAQIAGHELGAPLDWVTVVMGDTAVVPYDQQTSASRSTVLMGNAVLAACRDIQARLRGMASRLHDVPEADIVVAEGRVRLPDREVAHPRDPGGRPGAAGRRAHRRRGDPQGRRAGPPALGCAGLLRVQLHGHRGRGRPTRPGTSPSSATSSSPTWARRSIRCRCACRTTARPSRAWATPSWSTTSTTTTAASATWGPSTTASPRAWTCRSEMVSEIVENGDGPGPYGAKGMSEGALLCVAAAVAGAVSDASGVVIRDLPLTPERVWRALRDAEREHPSRRAPGEEQT